MKVIVDSELCEANAVCVGQSEEVFRLHDDDTLNILLPEIPERLRSQVEEAVRLCPRQALRIED
jgi:ferredoxin